MYHKCNLTIKGEYKMITKIKNSLPTKEQIKTVFPDLKEKDLELLLHIAEQTGLDILRKQIWAIPRGGKTSIETSIDGFRLIAERTGKYAPGKEPQYEYNEKGFLIKATAFVKKMTDDGTWHEVAVSAMMSEYNANQGLWKSKPHVMLSKCAESQALRRSFPDAFSGLYSEDEMGKADNLDTKEDMKEQIAEDDKPIDDTKLAIITEKISKIPEDQQIDVLDKVLEWCKVEELKDIPNKNYQAVVVRLNKQIIGKGK